MDEDRKNVFAGLGITEEDVDERIQKAVRRHKSIDLASPSVDRTALFYLDSPIDIVKTASLVEGTTPSVEWNIQYSDDTSNFTSLFNSDQTTDSTSTTELSFPDVKRVPSGFYLWLNIASTSGTVDHFDLTIIYDQ